MTECNIEECECEKFKTHKIRCILGKIHDRDIETTIINRYENEEEHKYKSKGYIGSFHKGLQHDINGKLERDIDYEDMRCGITKNNQEKLRNVPLAINGTLKLANPLASLSKILIGGGYCEMKIKKPPTLSSKQGASEMVELYCKQICRDIPFITYETNQTIKKILGDNYMNSPEILKNLLNYYKDTPKFTFKSIFRGISFEEQYGPYMSQLLYLDIPTHACDKTAIYQSPLQLISSLPSRVEWGVKKEETVIIQNTDLNNVQLPGSTDKSKIAPRYIYCPRVLTEAVRFDPPAYYYIAASQILNNLGAQQNTGFPKNNNQGNFITGCGLPAIQCAIGNITELSLKHAWYWKWQIYRKVRPEVFGLYIDNIKSNRESNNDYQISDIILNASILDDIKQSYQVNYGINNSYTLSSTYREGSPLHPSYPAGHAVIAGACCTILKIYYDCEKPWTTLQGVSQNKLSGNIKHPVCANIDGTELISYNENDKNNMTISGEINKLASNISLARDWAGVHYRSDSIEGMLLGEQIAIKYMGDIIASMAERNIDGSSIKLSFRKFDGSFTTVQSTIN